MLEETIPCFLFNKRYWCLYGCLYAPFDGLCMTWKTWDFNGTSRFLTSYIFQVSTSDWHCEWRFSRTHFCQSVKSIYSWAVKLRDRIWKHLILRWRVLDVRAPIIRRTTKSVVCCSLYVAMVTKCSKQCQIDHFAESQDQLQFSYLATGSRDLWIFIHRLLEPSFIEGLYLIVNQTESIYYVWGESKGLSRPNKKKTPSRIAFFRAKIFVNIQLR